MQWITQQWALREICFTRPASTLPDHTQRTAEHLCLSCFRHRPSIAPANRVVLQASAHLQLRLQRSVYVLDDGKAGMDNSIPSKALAKSSAAACIRREWNGRSHPRYRTLGSGGLAGVYCRSDCSRFASNDYLPRCIEVCGTHITSTWSQHCAIALSSNPSTAAMEPWPSGTAACISSPRRRTRAIPSVKLMAPAQTRAEYSPGCDRT